MVEDLSTCIECAVMDNVAIWYDTRLGKPIDTDWLHPKYKKAHVSQVNPIIDVLGSIRFQNMFEVHILTETAELKIPVRFYRQDNSFVCRDYDPIKIIQGILKDESHSEFFISHGHPYYQPLYVAHYSIHPDDYQSLPPNTYGISSAALSSAADSTPTYRDLIDRVAGRAHAAPETKESVVWRIFREPGEPESDGASDCDSCGAQEPEDDYPVAITAEEIAELEKTFGGGEEVKQPDSTQPPVHPHLPVYPHHLHHSSAIPSDFMLHHESDTPSEPFTRMSWMTQQAKMKRLAQMNRMREIEELETRLNQLRREYLIEEAAEQDSYQLHRRPPWESWHRPPHQAATTDEDDEAMQRVICERLKARAAAIRTFNAEREAERDAIQKRIDEIPPFVMPDLTNIPKPPARNDNIDESG